MPTPACIYIEGAKQGNITDNANTEESLQDKRLQKVKKMR